MPDNMFEDPSLYSGLQEDAKQYQEEHKQTGDYPLFYLDDGSYWCRIYPELVEKNGKKRLQLVRIFYSHKGFYKMVTDDKGKLKKEYVRRLPCEGADCRICKQVKRMDSAGMENAWQFARMEEGIVTMYIYRSTIGKSDYVVEEQPGFAIVKRKFIAELQRFIAEFDATDMPLVFDPTILAPQLKIAWQGGSQGGASIGLDIKKGELPEIPPDYPKMSEVFIDDTKYATDEELRIVTQCVTTLIEEKMNVFEPTTGEDGFKGPAPATEQPAKAEEADDDVPSKQAQAAKESPKEENVSETEAQSQENNDPPAATASKGNGQYCPGEEEGLEFGKHPTEESLTCIMCSNERECLLATEASKA